MNNLLRFVGSFLFIGILFILLYAYAMFQGGFVSWFLFFSFSPIFLYQIGLLFYPIQNWQVNRVLSHHTINAGDSITVVIQINRKFPFPLYYCIFEEVVPQTLKKIDYRSDSYYHLNKPNQLNDQRQVKMIIFPWFRRQVEMQYELKHVPRGEHVLSGIKMRTGDVFGFIKREHLYKVTDKLMAYPNKRQLRLNGKMSSFNQGTSTNQLFHLKNTNVVSSVREYVPGDKFSWIDWKQTARNHLMMTKEFEKEKNTDVLLILNSCHHLHVNPLAFEGAIEVTISFIGYLEKLDSNIELLSIGKDIVHIQTDNDIRKKESIRQHLTRLQPSDKHSFSKELLKQLMGIGRHSFIVIVTTDLDGAFDESVQKIRMQAERVIILFVRSEHHVSQSDLEMIQQLKRQGIMICQLTEKELVATPIEVNI